MGKRPVLEYAPLPDRHHLPTRDVLRMAIFEFVEVFCNR
jgi:hypothetical protein